MGTIPDNYLRIAKLGKIIGLKGEINLWPISNIDERFVIGSQFITDSNRELVIESIRTKGDHLVVRFVDCNSPQDIDGLVNTVLYAQALDDSVLDEGEYFVHNCLDKIIVDQNETEHGFVVRCHENMASDLLENNFGDLIPFNFIVGIDDKVHVEVPDGIFESRDNEL